MVKLTLKFDNVKDKIAPSRRKRLLRYAKDAHKFILFTQKDVDENKWETSNEIVGLSFGEILNLVNSFLLSLSEEYYRDDPEFLDKMRKNFDALLESMAQAREKNGGSGESLVLR